MVRKKDLTRFMEAQERDYQTAFAEVKKGKKRSHWMWYIFPQVEGLGISEISQFYAIKDIQEAESYLKHPVLGSRLIRICKELLKQDVSDANLIFGSPDDMKLKSCMTLFASLENTDEVFQEVLNKYFKGDKDDKTLSIITIKK
ncbi:MAG: calpastatin [Mucilaginibacter sp.]|nr:calpastatin [Mucilaginibacter sp.]